MGSLASQCGEGRLPSGRSGFFFYKALTDGAGGVRMLPGCEREQTLPVASA